MSLNDRSANSVGRVILSDPDGVVLKHDELTGILSIIDSPHYELHEGEMFTVSRAAEGFADDAQLQIIITTGAKEFHAIVKYVSGGNALFTIFEGPTTIVGGTAMTPRNRHRSFSDGLEGFTAIHTPTSIGGDGTLLETDLIAAGAGGTSRGGSGQGREEWVLDANTVYLFRLQNIAGTAQPLGMVITGYEHDPE